MNVKVLRMSGAKDPDEFIQKNGAAAFEVLLDRSENHIEYRLLAAQDKYPTETDEGRLGFLKEAVDILAGLSGALERDIYSRRVAEAVGVSPDAVQNEVNKAIKRKIAAGKKRREREAMRPEHIIQPRDKGLRYENVASAAAEEGVLRLLMLDPTLIKTAENLETEEFTSPCLGKTFAVIKERELAGKDVSAINLAQHLTAEEMSHVTAVLQKPETLKDGEAKLAAYIERIREEKRRRIAKEDPIKAMQQLRDKKGFGG